jgi:hypothetical protein
MMSARMAPYISRRGLRLGPSQFFVLGVVPKPEPMGDPRGEGQGTGGQETVRETDPLR